MVVVPPPPAPPLLESIAARTALRFSSHVADRVPDGADSDQNSPVVSDIVACGVIPWRLKPGNGGELQVLMIHRPEYQDWSWPKGKLDEDETLPECAIRETREEIGLHVNLGIPLPRTHYQVPSRTEPGRMLTKEVWYWAAEVNGNARENRAEPDGSEVDEISWVAATEAMELLTNEGDKLPLEALIAEHRAGNLQTRPVIILRHAKAKPRSSWSRAESERPLAATGKRQAWSVKKLLEAWNPERIVSSSWLRCVQTVAPYAQDHKKSIKQLPSLNEKKALKKPKKTRADIKIQLDKDRSSLLCTHRPVLPLVMDVLDDHIKDHTKPAELREVLRDALPDENPYLKPGSMVVAQRARNGHHRIVSLEIYSPYDI